jgi:hypothetical protein
MATFTNGAQYNVTSVSFGVESANVNQLVRVRLYTTTNFPAGFPGSLTQIGSAIVSVGSAQNGTVVTTPLVATVPAGTSQLVMELFTPDGRTAGHLFFVGSNAAAETGPSYVSASACGITTPTTTAAIGSPEMHVVFNVFGTCGGGATPTPTPRPATIGNISTRLQVGTSDRVMIAGFIVQGSAPKRVLIRAAGPSLANFGVPNALANPQLELHDSNTAIGMNDDWATTQIGGVITSDQVAEIQNSGLAPGHRLESAIIATLPPGSYTAIVQGLRGHDFPENGVNGGTGVGLVEVYDLDATSGSLLANMSTRGFVQTGDDVMIGGFIVVTQPTKVMIRAIGPSLTQFGVPDALASPQLELHDASGMIGWNDDWQTTELWGIITSDQVGEIQNSQLAPSSPAESAIIATLQPGSYTAIVRGVNDTTGNALVEVYALP